MAQNEVEYPTKAQNHLYQALRNNCALVIVKSLAIVEKTWVSC